MPTRLALLGLALSLPAFADRPEGLREMRIEHRRGHHLVVGLMPSLGQFYEPAEAGYTHAVVAVMPAGIGIGHRTHFLPRLGMKSMFHLSAGLSASVRLRDSLGEEDSHFLGHAGTVDDWSMTGATVACSPSIQALIGPFGAFSIEPGLGIAVVRHFIDTLSYIDRRLHRYAYYEPSPWGFYVKGLMGGSFSIGPREDCGSARKLTEPPPRSRQVVRCPRTTDTWVSRAERAGMPPGGGIFQGIRGMAP